MLLNPQFWSPFFRSDFLARGGILVILFPLRILVAVVQIPTLSSYGTIFIPK